MLFPVQTPEKHSKKSHKYKFNFFLLQEITLSIKECKEFAAKIRSFFSHIYTS